MDQGSNTIQGQGAHCMPWSAAMDERTRSSSSGSISTLMVSVSAASSRTGNARCTLRAGNRVYG